MEPPDASDRFFYHSFPRPRKDLTEAETCEKGLRITRSIADVGLLLTPELLRFREFLQDGTLGAIVVAAQKRACFTELAPSELPRHAREFGPFALELEIMSLRELGGMPVFYVPLTSTEVGLAGIGASLVCRLQETVAVLNRLAALSEWARGGNDAETIQFRMGPSKLDSRLTIGGLNDLLRFMSYEVQPHETLAAANDIAASLFYPTDNLHRDDILGYYRQREWRLLSGLVRHGVRHDRPLSAAEQERILEIDPEFFGHRDPYRVSRLPQRLEDASRIQVTKAYIPPDGKRIFAYVTRLICPDGFEERTREAIPAAPDAPPVVPMSAVAPDSANPGLGGGLLPASRFS